MLKSSSDTLDLLVTTTRGTAERGVAANGK